MNIHVVFAHSDGTTDNANFVCVHATRTMFAEGRTSIVFSGGPAVHTQTGRAIGAALFAKAAVIYSYED